MTNEFKKISLDEETRYVLEFSGAGTTAGVVATGNGKQKSLIAQEGDKVKSPVAKAAQKVAKGAGKHKNSKDAVTQPRKEKHKKDPYAESLEQSLASTLAEQYDIPPEDTPEYDQFIRRGGINQKSPYDLGGADAYYGRQNNPAEEYGFQKGSPEWDEYIQGYRDTHGNQDMRKDYGTGRASSVAPRRITKTPESALDDFRKGADERKAKHDKIEADRKASAAQGRTDVKGAVDRLKKHINTKGVAEGDEYNEYSDEVDMVENNLLTIIRACKELANTLKAGENLPEWVEEKISMSKQNMVTVSEYLQSQHDQGHVYDEDHSTATGGWGQGSMNAAYQSSALSGAGHDDRTMEGYFSCLQEKLDAEVDERSVSQAQAQMMAAAAHNPAFAKKVGIKTNVAKEFNRADIGKDISKLPKRVLPKKKK